VKTPDELVAEARAAGNAQNHQGAVQLFEEALTHAPERRVEWLRELADQTAYAGNPARAVDLYREILTRPEVPQTEQDRAKRGLAFALLWSGQADPAVQALTELASRAPDDGEVAKALSEAQRLRDAGSPPQIMPAPPPQTGTADIPAAVTPAVGKAASARSLMERGANKEAAAAFAEALALDDGLFPQIGREYADQLAFGGEPARSVEIYKRVLALPGLDAGEGARARRGLAFALLWSGQSRAAVGALTDVVASAPEDAEAKKALADARAASTGSKRAPAPGAARSPQTASPAPLPSPPPPPSRAMKQVLAGRQAAGRGANAEAVGHYAEALRLEPSLFTEIGVEYADQVAYSGDPARAVELYRRALQTPRLQPNRRTEIERKLAFAYLWSNEFRFAVSAWEPILRARPRDGEARSALADSLIGFARAEAGVPRNAQAARLFERAFSVAPERRRGLLREYADQILYSGAGRAAIPVYRELLTQRDLNPDERQKGLLGLARAHAWSGDATAAVPVYTELLDTWPKDVSARIGRGQSYNSLAFHERAFADFAVALSVEPGNEEAVRGTAQSETSMGRHRSSLARLSGLLAVPSPDRRTLLIAVNASRSSGRPDRAESMARQMLAINADDAEAQALLDGILNEQRPLTKVDTEVISRSDDLTIKTIAATHEMFANQGLTTFGFQARLGAYRGGDFPAYDIASAGVLARHRLNDWVEARTSALINHESGEDEQDTTFTHDSTVSFFLNDTWRGDVQVVRRYADENPEVFRNDVLADDLGGAVFITPQRNIRATVRGYYSSYSDDNERVWGQTDAAYNVLETGNLWFGARATAFGFEEDFDNGYWNPGSYQSLHGTIHAFGSPGAGWWTDVQGALGYAWSEQDSDGLTASIEGRISRELTSRSALELKALYQYSAARSNETSGTGSSEEPFQRGMLGLQFRTRW
jgi:tetratricopeptide (TPR) repeat protein